MVTHDITNNVIAAGNVCYSAKKKQDKTGFNGRDDF